MKTQRRVLLSLLWIQICCELRTSQGNIKEHHTYFRKEQSGGEDGGSENMSLLGCILQHEDRN